MAKSMLTPVLVFHKLLPQGLRHAEYLYAFALRSPFSWSQRETVPALHYKCAQIELTKTHGVPRLVQKDSG